MACCDHRIVSQMQADLDRMAHKLAAAESQISTERLQERRLDEANHGLSDELSAAVRLNSEKDSALATADRQLTDLRTQLVAAETNQQRLQAFVDKVEKEKRAITNNLNETKRSGMAAQQDAQDLQDFVVRLQDDKKRLAQRIDKLTANERVLVLEIERLRRQGAGSKKSAGPANQVEAYMAGIEQDRDYYKGEVELLNKKMSTSPINGTLKHSTSLRGRSASPAANGKSSRSSSPLKKAKNGVKKGLSTEKLKSLEEENNRLIRELESYKTAMTQSNMRSASPKRTKSVKRSTKAAAGGEVSGGGTDTEERGSDNLMLGKLRCERDELRNLLNKLERRVSEIQGDVRCISQERDHFNQLYEESQREVNQLRQDLVSATQSTGASNLAAQTILQRTEVEKENLLGDLRRTTAELEAVRSRYESAMDSLTTDKHRADHQINDLKGVNHQLTMERDDLLNRANSLRENMMKGEAELSAKEREHADKAVRLQREIQERTSRITHLEGEVCQRDRESADMKAELMNCQQQLTRCERALECRQRDLQAAKCEAQETGKLLAVEAKRSQDIARHKDRCQEDVATLTRETQALQSELQELAHERAELRRSSQELCSQVKRLEAALTEKDSEQSELLQQYRSIAEDVDNLRSRTQQLQNVNCNLKADLTQRNCEIDHLRKDLDHAQKCIRDNKATINAYEMQINSLKVTVDDLNAQLCSQKCDNDKICNDVANLRDINCRLEESKKCLQEELKRTQDDLEQTQCHADELEAEVELNKDEMRDKEGSNKSLEETLQAVREKQFQAELTAQDNQAEANALKDRLSCVECKLEQAQNEIDRLKTRNYEMERESERLQRGLAAERFEKDRVLSEMRIQSLIPPYVPSGVHCPSARSNTPFHDLY